MTQEEKEYVRERLEQAKRETENAEVRTKATIKRGLQRTHDGLYVVQNGLKEAIEARKTSLTQMTNMLAWINDAIDNMKELGLWSEW